MSTLDHLASQASQLRLVLPRRVRGQRTGGVALARPGSSLDWHDFRPYAPGDDVRHIDWSASARTDDAVVRLREEDIAPRVEVVLDASASMSVDATKQQLAATIAGLACLVAAQQGLESQLLVAGQESLRRSRGGDVLAVLEGLSWNGQQPLVATQIASLGLRRCGLRLVVSDFLFEADPMPVVGALARHAQSTVLFQVLASSDLAPELGGVTELQDSENGQTERVQVDEVTRAAYLERLRLHMQAYARASARLHVSWGSLDSRRSLPELLSTDLRRAFEVGRAV